MLNETKNEIKAIAKDIHLHRTTPLHTECMMALSLFGVYLNCINGHIWQENALCWMSKSNTENIMSHQRDDEADDDDDNDFLSPRAIGRILKSFHVIFGHHSNFFVIISVPTETGTAAAATLPAQLEFASHSPDSQPANKLQHIYMEHWVCNIIF